jgi:hypothetical protein
MAEEAEAEICSSCQKFCPIRGPQISSFRRRPGIQFLVGCGDPAFRGGTASIEVFRERCGSLRSPHPTLLSRTIPRSARDGPTQDARRHQIVFFFAIIFENPYSYQNGEMQLLNMLAALKLLPSG